MERFKVYGKSFNFVSTKDGEIIFFEDLKSYILEKIEQIEKGNSTKDVEIVVEQLKDLIK